MKKVTIIAEAGVNHNGDISTAKALIDVAAEAKVDYVKFQLFKTEKLVSKVAPKADYQKRNTKNKNPQYEMLKKLELSAEQHVELIGYCIAKGIKYLASGFDPESIDFLVENKIDLIKIPSGEITNYPYLKTCASKKIPIILSTGMCFLQDIENALITLTENGASKENITVLHCNTEYPTPMSDVNLNAMNTIKKRFGVKVGYSDHTLGIEVPIAAVAIGADVIEKHFTLSRTMNGPDHSASLEPKELKNMVEAIRNVEIALGNDEKKPSKSEQKNIVIARKSIHTQKDILANTILEENMLIMKRPGDGISPMDLKMIIGRKINRDLTSDYKLSWKDII